VSSIPVGLVKDLKPLGHSGHLRLQEVVGSNEMLMGIPEWLDMPLDLDL